MGEGITAEGATAERAQRHAWELQIAREHAVAYLQELVHNFPAAAGLLEKAVSHYGRELEATQKLQEVCEAQDEGEFFDEARAEVQELVTAALEADRAAIGSIEAVVAVLTEAP